MNSLAKLAPLGLFSLLVAAACGTAPSPEEGSETVAASNEAVFAGVSGSITASPNPVYVAAAGDLGTTTISWRWSESAKQYPYACVYVQTNGGTPKVFDCEKENNTYTVSAPWIGVGEKVVFGIIPQQAPVQETYANPVPWVASVTVEALVGETCTNPCKALDVGPVSCTGATCTVNPRSVTCDGVSYMCQKDPCPTCDKRR